MPSNKYVLDTNIFNRILDGRLSINDLPSGAEFFATHVQIEEINQTNDTERRALLFLIFAEIRPSIVSTESFALGVSRIGHAKISKRDNLAKLVQMDLDTLNGGKANNIKDALIAEVAAVHECVLLTADHHLAQVAKKHGIRCIYHNT